MNKTNKMGSGKALAGCARQCNIKRTTQISTNIAYSVTDSPEQKFQNFTVSPCISLH